MRKAVAALVYGLLMASPGWTQPVATIEHSAPPPPFLVRIAPHEAVQGANAGLQIERGHSASEELADFERLNAALVGLEPQRPGTVDAYIVSVALDSDPVFAREAREAAAVLARRYGGVGRTIVLAGPNGRNDDSLPRGAPRSLDIALARIAEIIDADEDVLILYLTSHGTPNGVFYHFGDAGYGAISPSRMAAVFADIGIRNRLLIINACFSGIFVSGLANADSAVIAAAGAGLTSFGCVAGNDWTYFGDALVNNALRQPVPLETAFRQARRQVDEWEKADGLTPSQPQIAIGAGVSRWLGPLEARMPQQVGDPVGRPARSEESPTR